APVAPEAAPASKPPQAVAEPEPVRSAKPKKKTGSESTTTLAGISSGTRGVLGYPLFEVGGTTITLGGILWVAGILFAAWLASRWLQLGLARYGKNRPEVSRPALYALGRVLHYLLIAIGIGVALSAIGLDLTKVAFFATALGVGIGFGLQTVVNNFISGLILLFERSLKIGDFVELESGVTGEVTDISIRATRVTTNDNIDILVPNSEFVNGRVTSWTLRETARRIKVKFGVAYGTDKELVKKAALEAAATVPFTFASEGPRRSQVWLVNFGDNSLDFQLVVWLTADCRCGEASRGRPGRLLLGAGRCVDEVRHRNSIPATRSAYAQPVQRDRRGCEKALERTKEGQVGKESRADDER
ncbi:MAG TPA: mechanosensitive ion channel domain-containing protein, partial [Dokdonella sp.]|uniref:mechanosensitive ion channel family protein n=1 Tax=Dokdonella sp. TaxID=2291710 RepID=UPI002D7F0C9B